MDGPAGRGSLPLRDGAKVFDAGPGLDQAICADLFPESTSINGFVSKSSGSNGPGSGELHSIAAQRVMCYEIFGTD